MIVVIESRKSRVMRFLDLAGSDNITFVSVRWIVTKLDRKGVDPFKIDWGTLGSEVGDLDQCEEYDKALEVIRDNWGIDLRSDSDFESQELRALDNKLKELRDENRELRQKLRKVKEVVDVHG